MELKIGGKVYQLYFGIAFIREIDRRYEVQLNDVGYGGGLSKLIPKVQIGDVVALFDTIEAATVTEHTPPTSAAVEEFLAQSEVDTMELGASFIEAFEGSKIVSKAVQVLLEITNQLTTAMAKLDEMEEESSEKVETDTES